MSARAQIFGAIRKSLPAPASEAVIAAELAALRARVPATRPDRVRGEAAEIFFKRVQSPGIAATAEWIANLGELPAAVARYAAAQGLNNEIAVQPDAALAHLDWSKFQTHQGIATDETLAVGLALGGIAETGTLVFHSSPASPTLFAFLPLHHVVAVRADQIWPWLEDYVASFQGAPPPRNVNFVTGASGTTDIEGALVKGAHGPGSLHIVLVDAGPSDEPG
jgi:L-lactate dehydrogenase complex protein LldG